MGIGTPRIASILFRLYKKPGQIIVSTGRLGARVISGTVGQVPTVQADGSIEFATPSGGGGGGAVASVNGQVGVVVLTALEIAETATRKWLTDVGESEIANGVSHRASSANPHSVTAAQVGADASGTASAAVAAHAGASDPHPDYIQESREGVANGVAPLDSSSNIPLVHLGNVVGGMENLGSWNASTNTPALSDGSGTGGTFYVVSVTGSTEIDGVTDWVAGDHIVSEQDGTWYKIDRTDAVASVNGFTGAVALDASHIDETSTRKWLTDTEKSEIAANTLKVSNATHTGDVTGSVALTIAGRAIDAGKLFALTSARFLGRVAAGSGDVEELTAAQMKTALGAGLADGLATLDATGNVPLSELGNAPSGGGSIQPDARYGYAGATVNVQNVIATMPIDAFVVSHPDFDIVSDQLVAKAGTSGTVWVSLTGMVRGDGSGTGSPSGTAWVRKDGVEVADSRRIASARKLEAYHHEVYAEIAYVAGTTIDWQIDHDNGTTVGFFLDAGYYEILIWNL